MKIEYVFTASEIKAAKDRLAQLRQAALLSRDAKEMEDSKEFYFKAKGFEEALTTLGIVQEVKDEVIRRNGRSPEDQGAL